ncbi:K02A2.6-like [Cordylochernes scorpioides]|uniref:K02A2.6-like n=1 Tax=Cordylochernes scorpioides TaxID=51811 RepID=A0ABY6KLG3_9ARAC|nr:K02A2.6-like [Cordylochernes scorpioides]
MANKEKCKLIQDRLEYCDHLIDRNGLHNCVDKIRAIIDSSEPLHICVNIWRENIYVVNPGKPISELEAVRVEWQGVQCGNPARDSALLGRLKWYQNQGEAEDYQRKIRRPA